MFCLIYAFLSHWLTILQIEIKRLVNQKQFSCGYFVLFLNSPIRPWCDSIIDMYFDKGNSIKPFGSASLVYSVAAIRIILIAHLIRLSVEASIKIFNPWIFCC